jgi:hypothetical protein
MAWRFRKTFSPLPGVRLTLSPRGVTTSVGVGPLRVSSGPAGSALSATLPGTGLSFRQPLKDNGQQPTRPTPQWAPPSLPAPVDRTDSSLQEIRSTGANAMTTPGLGEYKALLQRSRAELADIDRELVQAVERERRDVGKHASWKNGWLLRRIFKTKFVAIAADAEESSARRIELDEQKELAQLRTDIEMPPVVEQAYARMCDDFVALCRSARLWDTVGARAANRVAERTTAARVIDRKPVAFSLGQCPLIQYKQTVPHLDNANGGAIYLYPAFALYFVSADNFALLEYKELEIAATLTRFQEEDGVPPDSKVVGHTWAKANKNGTPDLRFKDNYQIPIAQYGKIVLRSPTGMNEEYMISNAESTEQFGRSLELFRAAIDR